MFNITGTTLTSTNYYYDSANQLTKTNVNDGDFTQYKYDANGNRVAKIQPDNVVTKYTWDYENRLTNVQMHQGKFVDYEYDGDGNRISKIAGVKQPLMKDKPNQDKVKKQQAEIIYNAANNENGNDGNNDNGNDGDNGNGNGNGKDKDDPDGDKSGNGKGKGNAKDLDKAKNKDLSREDRNKKKENAKQGKGYRQKGKYNNRGKHLGWYKNKNKLEQQIKETYYLNDVYSDLSQVMMTYDDSGMFDTAYTYGVERIGIDILDGTRPDAQNPLYYLYDGQGSVTYVTKPDGEKRDTLTYDEFGKPRTGKLSPDGDKILHTSFGYNGEQWDEESRLQYLRARYYEPETGRFLSRDTYQGELQNPLSKHLYTYVQNNPINKIDPSGNMSIWQVDDLGSGIIDAIHDIIPFNQIEMYIRSWQTWKAIYDIGMALYNKKLTFTELGISIVNSTIDPIKYVYNNTNKVFGGNPSDKEVYKYGYNLGDTLFTIATSVVAVARMAKFIPQAGKFLTALREDRFISSILKSSSSKLWGVIEGGTNQGVKHFTEYWSKYPDRIPSLAKRLGVNPSLFANTVKGFENFTAQAIRVIKEGDLRKINGKKIYYLDGVENANKGVVVITKDGKIQSMMPSDRKSFNKLR